MARTCSVVTSLVVGMMLTFGGGMEGSGNPHAAPAWPTRMAEWPSSPQINGANLT
jgi:hypothetical protein